MDCFVTFNINDQVMGMNMLNVERIIKLLKISPIPNASEQLEGVIDVQNRLIPTINLKKKFGFESKLIQPDSNVIIIVDGNERCGIIVDIVDDIVEINDNDIVKTQGNKYVYGVVKVNNTIINLLNSSSLILD